MVHSLGRGCLQRSQDPHSHPQGTACSPTILSLSLSRPALTQPLVPHAQARVPISSAGAAEAWSMVLQHWVTVLSGSHGIPRSTRAQPRRMKDIAL